MFCRKKTYDIIYSLGSNCSAAGFLNKHYLRVSSGPFDWWMMQNPCEDNFECRARLVCSHFSNFLKKENLEYVELPEDEPRDPDFDPYLDHGYPGIYLPHDFPIGEPMEQNYDMVKAKYDRRIARFYEKIQASDRVLLVWICIDDVGCDPKTVKRLCDEMCDTFGKTVDFLLIWQDDSMALDQAAVKQQLAPNIELWRANIYRNPTGKLPEFMGGAELVSPILKSYALKGTRWLIFKARARVIFGRYLCLFIPVRRWRKRLHVYFRENELNKDFSRDIRDRRTTLR